MNPNDIEGQIDRLAQELVSRLSPLQIGQRVYPDATPVSLNEVPRSVYQDHLTRYTPEELAEGQFFEVLPDKYTFFMGHKAYKRRQKNR